MPPIRFGSPLTRILCVTALPVIVLAHILIALHIKSQQEDIRSHQANELVDRIEGILEFERSSTETAVEAISARVANGDVTPLEPYERAALRLDIVVLLDDGGNRLWTVGRGDLLGDQFSNGGSGGNPLKIPLSRKIKTGLSDLGIAFSVVSVVAVEQPSAKEGFRGRIIGFRLFDSEHLARLGQVKRINLTRQTIVSQSARRRLDQSWRHTWDGRGTLLVSRLISGIALNEIFSLSIEDSDPTERRYSSLLVSFSLITAGSWIVFMTGMIIFGNRDILYPLDALTFELKQLGDRNRGAAIPDVPFSHSWPP